jgi:hypothetical protein
VIIALCTSADLAAAQEAMAEMERRGLHSTEALDAMLAALFAAGRVSDALRYFVDRQFKQVAACGLSSYGILVDGLIRNGRQKVLHYCVLSY